MIHAAHFDRGRVTYRNKWVRTDAMLEEARAGASPFWGIMGTLKGRSDRRLKDTANTDVIAHGGHAVASWYMAGTPYIIDPITLETVRKADYIRAPGNGFSAHPKVDEHTGELCYFDYGHEHPYMWYGVVDAGSARWSITSPWSCPARGCRTTWRSPSTTRSCTTCRCSTTKRRIARDATRSASIRGFPRASA
jgi:carotenoid cleavage dioxygenase-like enzyme